MKEIIIGKKDMSIKLNQITTDIQETTNGIN